LLNDVMIMIIPNCLLSLAVQGSALLGSSSNTKPKFVKIKTKIATADCRL